jgi:hypothetical protein
VDHRCGLTLARHKIAESGRLIAGRFVF